MALVVPNASELRLLDLWLDATNSTLKVYSNNVTPSATSVAGDFTEATFTGYSAKTLTGTSWGAATTVSNKASASYAQQTWSPTSSQTVYGYYVVDGSGNLLWAERFATSRPLANGDTLAVTPVFTLSSES